VIIRFITQMDVGSPHDPFVNESVTVSAVGRPLSVELLQSVPEEELWLAGQQSVNTRRAYKQDVAHFV
jgi:hypothetical protein